MKQLSASVLQGPNIVKDTLSMRTFGRKAGVLSCS